VTSRLRLAELTSSLGAGVVGLGIGVVLASRMRGLGVPVLVLGALFHAWGMTDKHRQEAKAGVVNVWWSMLLYWMCWLLLAALAVYVVVRQPS
jgi:uncharacterized membrane protein YecN with MAPEG domain